MVTRNSPSRARRDGPPDSVASSAAVEPFPLASVWGKSRGLAAPYPLVCHLLDAAMASRVLVEQFCTASQRRIIAESVGTSESSVVRGLVSLAAAWHDVGKATPSFQSLDRDAFRDLTGDPPGARSGGLPHATAGCRFVFGSALLAADGDGGPPRRFAQVIGGHHGLYPTRASLDASSLRTVVGRLPFDGADERVQDRWRATRERVAAVVQDAVGLLGSGVDLSVLARCLSVGGSGSGVLAGRGRFDAAPAMLVTGLVVVADWLVSQESFIGQMQHWQAHSGWSLSGSSVSQVRAAVTHARAALPQVEAVVHESGLVGPALSSSTFGDRFPFEPRGIQKVATDTLPALVGDRGGMFVVMAPTGDGKTEAALHAASVMAEKAGSTGVFMALPTMATTDAMYLRVLDFCRVSFKGEATRLSLMHGRAALNDTYVQSPSVSAREAEREVHADLDGQLTSEADSEGDTCGGSVVDVTTWLRGPRRSILAPNSVGTVDQVLMAGLASKWNMLRWLGLTRKVVIVDEAHAYDAYMQALLRVVLTWLGRYNVPVILLSATLSGSLAKGLVRSYVEGAQGESSNRDIGHATMGGVTYPGWVYYDTASNAVTGGGMDPSGREGPLSVRMVGYPFDSDGDGRFEAVRPLVQSLADGAQGSILVVCNTVGESIHVHTALRDWLAGAGVAVTLIHARFPVGQRADQSSMLERLYGKHSRSVPDGETAPPRPFSSIVVATQLVEQSLDVDFDLVVSELAPMAGLLQRAGRGHRHHLHAERLTTAGKPCGDEVPTQRPEGFRTAELVVLVPTRQALLSGAGGDGGLISGPCGALQARDERPYQQSLLNATYRALAAHFNGGTVGIVNIPDGVQGLIDRVYDADFSDASLPELTAAVRANAQNAIRESAAHAVAIPKPYLLSDMADLTSPLDPDDAMALFASPGAARVSARYDMNTLTLLPVWADDAENLFLDAELALPLPTSGRGRAEADGTRRFTTAQIELVVAHTIAVPAWDGLRQAIEGASASLRPHLWDDTPMLSSVLANEFVLRSGAEEPIRSLSIVGSWRMVLSRDQGLDLRYAREETT